MCMCVCAYMLEKPLLKDPVSGKSISSSHTDTSTYGRLMPAVAVAVAVASSPATVAADILVDGFYCDSRHEHDVTGCC